MRLTQLPTVLLAGTLLTGAWGCRPGFMSVLNTPIHSAEDLVQETRLHHSGGRRILNMTFLVEQQLHGGLGEWVFPELGSQSTGRMGLDFLHGQAWQVAQKGQRRVLWWWDGQELTAQMDGRDYGSFLGVDRARHLKTWLWLMQPLDVATQSAVTQLLLPARRGHLRMGVEDKSPGGGAFTLEVDRSNGLTVAAERKLGPVTLRWEFEEMREVAGVRVPHEINCFLLTVGGALPLMTAHVRDVELNLESAYPGPLGPGEGARPEGTPASDVGDAVVIPVSARSISP